MKDRKGNNIATPRFTVGEIVTNNYIHCMIVSVDDPMYDVYSIIILEDGSSYVHHKIYLNETWVVA